MEAVVNASLSQWIRRTTMLVNDKKLIAAMLTRITVAMLEASLRGFQGAGMPLEDVLNSAREIWAGLKGEMRPEDPNGDGRRALEKEALTLVLSHDPAKAPPWILEIQKRARDLEAAHVCH